jgi:hypothetical protein
MSPFRTAQGNTFFEEHSAGCGGTRSMIDIPCRRESYHHRGLTNRSPVRRRRRNKRTTLGLGFETERCHNFSKGVSSENFKNIFHKLAEVSKTSDGQKPDGGELACRTFSRRRRPHLIHNNELAGMSSFHALPFLVKSYANHPENQSICLFTFECHGIKLSARFF